MPMASPQQLGTDLSGRKFYTLDLDRIEDWPARLDVQPPHFVLFLACDAAQLDVETISDFAETTMDQGLAYICAWGRDCERLHDIFDECHVMRTLDLPKDQDKGVLMTTWHETDTLEDALEFFFRCAVPNEDFAPVCKAWLAASIGSSERVGKMRSLLHTWLGKEGQGAVDWP